MRQRPATEAVVFFAMDVSSSMTERDRRLAKTFFFWVVQGLRRQYTHIEPVFVAHTIEAWEFAEQEFFQVSGSGGTVASSAFKKISEIAAQRYDPGRFNIYVFYASDGANFRHDRESAQAALAELGEIVNYIGYVETASAAQQALSLRDVDAVRAARSRDRRRRPLRAVDARVGLGRDPRRSSASSRRSRSRRGRGARQHTRAGSRSSLASHGLDYYPVHFEEVPSSFMMEIAVYGLPVRMPHWSFGVRYIHQLVQHRMGHSRLFEVVFPGNPGRAYLAGNNSLQENTLVTAHVLGHADFAKNNSLFKRSQEQVGYKIVEQAATHARQIGQAVEHHGQMRVEQVLDAALSLEAHIDTFQALRRDRYPEYVEASAAPVRRSVPEALRRLARRARGRRCAARAHARRYPVRSPSATCCGSSRSTRPSSRNGSATSFARCARSRSTSTPCSRARS